MPKSVSEEVKQQWKEKILKQRESGLSIGAWCRQNNINVHTFRYWQNKFLPKPNFNRSAFKEIPQQKTVSFKLPIINPRKKTEITIEYQGAYIYIERVFDFSTTLRECLKALKEI
jgi:hypothetical protein